MARRQQTDRERVERNPAKRGSVSGGMYKQSIFHIWCAMRARCLNPNNHAFHNYGGRGIKVCKRWLSFANFLADMGPRPAGKCLERKNNDLGYSPKNCVWATRIEQANNTRANVLITARGTTLTVTEWARKLKVLDKTIFARLYAGWEPERAVLEPPNPCRRRTHCPQGHPYSGSNLQFGWKGENRCRECNIVRLRLRAAKRRAA